LDDGVNVVKCFVDTVGDPEYVCRCHLHPARRASHASPLRYYAKKLTGRFQGQIEFVVEKKADATYRTVSAASICAKVLRDQLLDQWVYAERGLQDGGHEFGSGYPGDERCVAWLEKHVDPIFGFPSLVRFSWSTVNTLFANPKHGVRKVQWEEDDEAGGAQPTLTDMFGGAKKKKRRRVAYHTRRGAKLADVL
jgi:ribonuclease H2 subunit A